MGLTTACVTTFLAGIVLGVLATRYIRSTAASRPGPAATYDLALGLLTTVLYQTWALQLQRVEVLLAWDFGAALGTYLTLKIPRLRG